jgi:peptidoglycan/LPS O-acetylase OafA/YrhL
MSGSTARNNQLDGLRAFAVLAVIAYHAEISILGQGGMFGVDVFFVLSGFLITGVLVGEREQRGRIALGRFYLRRVLRLYPALVVMVVVMTPFATKLVLDGSWETWFKAAAAALTYSSTIILIFDPTFAMGALGHTWSLAIEEQFYLLWAPVLAVCLLRVRDARALAAPVAGLAAGLMALFWILWGSVGPALYYRPDPRFGELLAGAALALVLAGRPASLSRSWDRALGAGVIVALVALWWARRTYPSFDAFDVANPLAGIPVVAGATALLIARLVTSDRALLSRALRLPPLPFIGRISYGLYLWHLPLFALIASDVLQLVATFAAAVASYYVVELPFLRRKQRLRTTGVAGLTAADGGVVSGPPTPPPEREPKLVA